MLQEHFSTSCCDIFDWQKKETSLPLCPILSNNSIFLQTLRLGLNRICCCCFQCWFGLACSRNLHEPVCSDQNFLWFRASSNLSNNLLLKLRALLLEFALLICNLITCSVSPQHLLEDRSCLGSSCPSPVALLPSEPLWPRWTCPSGELQAPLLTSSLLLWFLMLPFS